MAASVGGGGRRVRCLRLSLLAAAGGLGRRGRRLHWLYLVVDQPLHQCLVELVVDKMRPRRDHPLESFAVAAYSAEGLGGLTGAFQASVDHDRHPRRRGAEVGAPHHQPVRYDEDGKLGRLRPFISPAKAFSLCLLGHHNRARYVVEDKVGGGIAGEEQHRLLLDQRLQLVDEVLVACHPKFAGMLWFLRSLDTPGPVCVADQLHLGEHVVLERIQLSIRTCTCKTHCRQAA